MFATSSPAKPIVPEGLFEAEGAANLTLARQGIVERFDTLRYKYLTAGKDGNVKSLIDLSQPNTQAYARDVWWSNGQQLKPAHHLWSPHFVMVNLCKTEWGRREETAKKLLRDEGFLFGHYLGSFSSYGYRNDARKGGLRTYDIWKKRSEETKGETSTVVRPWLRGFVDLVGGPAEASWLLRDAGQFPDGFDELAQIKEYTPKYDFDREKKAKIGRKTELEKQARLIREKEQKEQEERLSKEKEETPRKEEKKDSEIEAAL